MAETRVVDQDGAAVSLPSAITFERIRGKLKRGGAEVIDLGRDFELAYDQVQEEARGRHDALTWEVRAPEETGLSIRTIHRYRSTVKLADRDAIMASLPPTLLFRLAEKDVPDWLLEGIIDGTIAANEPTVEALLKREIRHREVIAPPPGQYRCIVMDPPWPIEKIQRQAYPTWQDAVPYPTMTLEELAGPFVGGRTVGELAAADGCHLYLWTTQKLLPAALDLMAGWGFIYHCTFAWLKPEGMTPFYWQYDWEPCLFGTLGSLPLGEEAIGQRLSIDARRDGHSTKPQAFYERVVKASPGPRLDLFARQVRAGFEGWGDEYEGDHDGNSGRGMAVE